MKKLRLLLFSLFLCSVALAQNSQQPAPKENNGGSGGSSNGPSVDASGTSVIDPTKNVLDLVQAAIKRIDDINVLDVKILDERFKATDKVIDLQDKITKLQSTHNAENITHNSELIKLRAEYQMQLDDKESKRIDAIRKVDQEAVKNEADRAQQAVATLATAQAATAETLRTSVNTTATNIATQLDRTTAAIVERIASLEKAQYTGQGRSTVADPQVEALRTQVETLTRSQAQGAGKVEGTGNSWGVISILAALVISALAIVMSRKTAHRR